MTTIIATKPQPQTVQFEVTNNKQLLPHIKKAFLSSILLSKDDIRRGYIEISGINYSMYVTDEVRDLLCDAPNTYRLAVMASFQVHTNNAEVVLCKLMEHNSNKRHQEYYKTECSRKAFAVIKSLFSNNN